MAKHQALRKQAPGIRGCQLESRKNRAKMWINCSDEGSGIISCSSHNITLKNPRTDRTANMTGTDTSSTSSVFSGVDEVNIDERYLSLL